MVGCQPQLCLHLLSLGVCHKGTVSLNSWWQTYTQAGAPESGRKYSENPCAAVCPPYRGWLDMDGSWLDEQIGNHGKIGESDVCACEDLIRSEPWHLSRPFCFHTGALDTDHQLPVSKS
jgi:hypothetical protein